MSSLAPGGAPTVVDSRRLLFNSFQVDPEDSGHTPIQAAALASMDENGEASFNNTSSGARPLPKRITKEEIDELTKDIIGNYTEKQIEKLRALQERYDAFNYEPVRNVAQDSGAAIVSDDSGDPLFHFQSNLPQILKILEAEFQRRQSLSDSDGAADDGEDDDELRSKKREQMEAFKVDMVNNSAINEEKVRAQQLLALTQSLLGCGSGEGELLDVLFRHLALLEEDTSEPVEAIGPLERQIQMYQAVLRFRRDQNNYLKRICETLVQKLEHCFSQMSTMAPTQQLQEAVANSAEVQALRAENELLRREQVYLYYRLYGPKHQFDAKADKQKKYRKEVDDAYKQMVDADVAKKVVKAVKNSDAWIKKSQQETETFRTMMQQAHLKLMSIHAYGKMALNSNRALEKLSLEDQDGHLAALRVTAAFAEASAISVPRGVSTQQQRSPPPEAGLAPSNRTPSQHSLHLRSQSVVSMAAGIRDNCVKMNDTVQAIYRDLEPRVKCEVDAATTLLADCLRTRRMGDEVLRAYASAISNVADVVAVSGMHTAAAAMAVVTSLPSGVSKAAAEALKTALQDQLAMTMAQTIAGFTKSVVASVDHFGVMVAVERLRDADPALRVGPSSGGASTSVATQTAIPLSRLLSAGGGGASSGALDDDAESGSTHSGAHGSGSSPRSRRALKPREQHLLGDGGTTPRGSDGMSRRGSASAGGSEYSFGRRGSSVAVEEEHDEGVTTGGAGALRRSKTTTVNPIGVGGGGKRKKSLESTKSSNASGGSSGSGASGAAGSGPEKKSPTRANGAGSSAVGGRHAHFLTGGEGQGAATKGPGRGGRSGASVNTRHDGDDEGDELQSVGTTSDAAHSDSRHHSPASGSIVASSLDATVRSATGMHRSVGVGTQPKHTRNAFCQVTILDSHPVRGQRSPGGDGASSSLPPAAMAELSVPKDVLAARRRGAAAKSTADPSSGGGQSNAAVGAQAASTASDGGAQAAAGEARQVVVLPPKISLPTSGELVFVFCGIDGAHVFWERCAEHMPRMLEVYLQSLRDALEIHNGFEARCESDAFLAVFRDIGDAVQWALSVQQHLMQLPYPKPILAQENGVRMSGPDGNFVWRGFRVRMGIHAGTPNFHTDVARGLVTYDGKCVTYASRLAMLANGGQVFVSNVAAERVREQLSQLVSVTVRPQGECPGEDGKQEIFDIVDAVTAGRHFSTVSGVDAPLSGGRLYQWLCTYSASHDFAVFERVVFAFVEVQNEADFPNYNGKPIAAAAAMVLDEAKKLAGKNNGSVVKTVGSTVMLAFKEAREAAKFALTLQGRAVQLPYPTEVLSIPECREIYEGNFVCWKGLKVRIGMHFGRPDQTVVNRSSRALEYFGGEVARAATVAGCARFGETVMSDAMQQEVMQVFSSLEGARLLHLGERRVEGELLSLHAIYSASLYPRHEKLSAGQSVSFFRRVMTATDVAMKPKDNAELHDYVLNETTYVLACCVDRAAELLEAAPMECTRAMNLFLAVLRDALIAHDGFEAHQDGVNCYCFFDTPEQAIVSALNVQDKLMHVPFPPDVERLFGEVIGDTSQDVIFRGLRVSMSLHRGRLHEFVAGAGMLKSYYGAAITQATFLATGYACGGELLLTEGVMTDLQETEPQTGFLANLHSYRIENILLPGDHRRTGVYGLLPTHLQARRRYFFRGKKAGVIANVAAGVGISSPGASSLSPASSPTIERRKMNKLTLDPQFVGTTAGLAGSMSSTASPFSPHGVGNFSFGGAGGGMGMLPAALLSGSGAASGPGGSTMIDFDLHPHRCNAQVLQRIYRTAWRVAGKTGRVMGYPVSVDADPVMFDAALREATFSNYEGEELDAVLFDTENTVLLRVEEMLEDAALALNCTLEKGTYFHRAMQSAIIIPPNDASDESLYKKADVGPGKTVSLSRDGREAAKAQGGSALLEEIRNQADAAAAAMKDGINRGFRPGVGADFAIDRMRERRLIELEQELERTRSASHADGGTVMSTSLVLKVDAGTQFSGANGIVPLRGGALVPVANEKALALTAPPPPLLPNAAGHRRAATPSGSLRKRQPPLSSLQTPYIPDHDPSSTLVLQGEPSSDVTLIAPFSNKVVPRPASGTVLLPLASGGAAPNIAGDASAHQDGAPFERGHHQPHVARDAKQRDREIRNRTSTLGGPARPGTLPFYAKREQQQQQQHLVQRGASRSGARHVRPPLASAGSVGHGGEYDPFPMPPLAGSNPVSAGTPSVDFVD